MKNKKIPIIISAVLVLALVGGGGYMYVQNQNAKAAATLVLQQEQEAAAQEQAKAEKLAAEEKAAAEKTEADKKAAEEKALADKLAAEQAEAEHLAVEQAAASNAPAAGTKLTDTLKYNDVEYGKVTLSGNLGSGKKDFNIEGSTSNWSYNNVAKDSICTIEPSSFDGYLSITLDSYILSDGIYNYNTRDDWTMTQLLADGQSTVGFGTFPHTEEYKPYFTSPGHPASFIFGRNAGTTPVYGGTYEYTLQPNGTLYILRCAVYNNSDEFVLRFNKPYFIGDIPTAAAEEKAAADKAATTTPKPTAPETTKPQATTTKPTNPADFPPHGDPIYAPEPHDGPQVGPFGNVEGYIYIPGYGYVEDNGGGVNEGTNGSVNDVDNLSGEKIGTMG